MIQATAQENKNFKLQVSKVTRNWVAKKIQARKIKNMKYDQN